MKNLIFTGGIAALTFLCHSGKTQTVTTPTTAVNLPNTRLAEITFNEEVYDYGNVKQGSNGDCVFTFTNTGTAPLIIADAKGSCQCTVADWPKAPIKPGETASIKVHYNTNRPGPINKTVTLTANIEGGTKVLRIKGNVEPAETAVTPVNNTGPRSEP